MSLKDYYDVMGARSENEKMHIKNVPARFINPYAIGDKLNHPPKHLPPNVILIDMHIPRFFFTESFMKFFPYMRADLPKESAMISRKSNHFLSLLKIEFSILTQKIQQICKHDE